MMIGKGKIKFDLLLSSVFCFIFISAFTFWGCKKEKESKPDFRTGFTGEFKFKICETDWYMSQDSIIHIARDTIFSNGSVEAYGKNQLLIKYFPFDVTGIWRFDTINCTGMTITMIDSAYISNPPQETSYGYFSGYYNNWVSVDLKIDSTMEVKCVPYRLEGGVHEAFGGYFIGTDSLYLFCSSGGLGAGSYKYIFGKRS